MSATAATLQGFAYGECLDGMPARSLGYQMLAPLQPESWSTEVETLAHQLQNVPYPDPWQPTDCFCSVLLSGGQRLVALVRYGQSDHTVSRRRGGIELVGVVGPHELDQSTALIIYRWLRQRLSAQKDLRGFGSRHSLAEISAAFPDPSPRASSRGETHLNQDQLLLLAAVVPEDLERHLRVLRGESSSNWQWLPLVSPAFPLQQYACRGPVAASLAHVAHGARPDLNPPRTTQHFRGIRRALAPIAGCLIGLLLAANLWAMLSRRASDHLPEEVPSAAAPGPVVYPAQSEPVASDSLAQALYRVLQEQQATKEWSQNELLQKYQELAGRDERLRVQDLEAKLAVGAIAALSHRTAAHLEQDIRDALSHKGYDEELVNLACVRVRQRLHGERP